MIPSVAAFGPHTIRTLLSESARAYRRRPLHYFGVSAVALMLSWTLDLVLRVWMMEDLSLGALDDPRTPALFAGIGRIFAAGVANGMIYALLVFAAQGIVARDVASALAGRHGPFRQAVIEALPRLPSLAGATLLFFGGTAILVAIGSLLAGLAGALGLTGGIFPGLLVGTGALSIGVMAIFGVTLRWAFFPQAVVLEGLGPLEALGRSLELTREARRPWSSHLADLYLVRAAAIMLVLIGLQLAAGAMGAIMKLAAGWLSGGYGARELVSSINPTGMPVGLLIPLEILSILLTAAVLPLALAASTLFYFDVRSRREAAASGVASQAPPVVHFPGGSA